MRLLLLLENSSKAGIQNYLNKNYQECLLSGRRLARAAAAGANRSSSGYVSCSECSYDSESCTCISADKCYCSLSRRVPNDPANSQAAPGCACDTDSCSDSNKCYCPRKSIQPTILEQLRQRGIVPSDGTLSRAGSPDRLKTARTSQSHASSRSLEFLKVRILILRIFHIRSQPKIKFTLNFEYISRDKNLKKIDHIDVKNLDFAKQ